MIATSHRISLASFDSILLAKATRHYSRTLCPTTKYLYLSTPIG
jgi:hypothetical protein